MIKHGDRSRDIRIHDAGAASIYAVNRDERALPPSGVTLTLKATHQFGELTVGSTRYHQAAQVERRVDRRVELWRDYAVDVRDMVRIDTEWYIIEQVDHGFNEDGIPVTRLSLERTDGGEWEGAYYAGQGG